MVKLPVAGRTKTRLARGAGLTDAMRFYRQTTAAVLARVGRDARWRTLLAVTPDTATRSSLWPARLPQIRQGAGDLGARMQRIFDTLPPGPVVIIGSDIPGITASAVAAAFTALGNHDAVVGPATDGGYWLIGLRRRPLIPRAFGAVRWSSAHALDDTLACLGALRIARIETLTDVDEAADLAAIGTIAGRRILPATR